MKKKRFSNHSDRADDHGFIGARLRKDIIC